MTICLHYLHTSGHCWAPRMHSLLLENVNGDAFQVPRTNNKCETCHKQHIIAKTITAKLISVIVRAAKVLSRDFPDPIYRGHFCEPPNSCASDFELWACLFLKPFLGHKGSFWIFLSKKMKLDVGNEPILQFTRLTCITLDVYELVI